MKAITTKQAVDTLIKALADEEYRYGWQANIAQAFILAWTVHDRPVNQKARRELHRVANQAAAAFLDQLIGKKMGELDGMAALHANHEQAQPLAATKKLKEYSFTLEQDADGKQWIHRRNDGFPASEIIVMMEAAKLDLLLQMHTHLAESTKRTVITRTVETAKG